MGLALPQLSIGTSINLEKWKAHGLRMIVKVETFSVSEDGWFKWKKVVTKEKLLSENLWVLQLNLRYFLFRRLLRIVGDDSDKSLNYKYQKKYSTEKVKRKREGERGEEFTRWKKRVFCCLISKFLVLHEWGSDNSVDSCSQILKIKTNI